MNIAKGQVRNFDFKQDGDNIEFSFDVEYGYEISVSDIWWIIFSEKEGFIQQKSLSGNKKSLGYGNHKLTWHVTKDMNELEGRVSFRLDFNAVKSSESSASYSGHGARNAWLSVLVPGWGNIYVDGQFGWWSFFGYSTSLIYAAVNHSEYSRNYDSYHNAKYKSQLNYYYETANTAYKNYQIGMWSAATIMAYDVIHVINRGSKNQKNGYKPNYRSGFSSFLLDAYVPGLGNISNGNDWGYLTLIGVPMCYIIGSNIKYQETAVVQPRDTLIFVGGLWHLFSAIYAGLEAHKLRAQYSSVYQPSPVQYAFVPNMYGGLQFCISKNF